MSDQESTPAPPLAPPPVNPPAPPPIPPDARPVEMVPLDKLPSPPWVIALAAFAGVAFLLGLIKGPHSFSLGVQYERGEQAYEKGDFASAAKNLRPVVDAYPEAEDARIDLATSYALTGDLLGAARQTEYFEGKMITKEQEEKA